MQQHSRKQRVIVRVFSWSSGHGMKHGVQGLPHWHATVCMHSFLHAPGVDGAWVHVCNGSSVREAKQSDCACALVQRVCVCVCARACVRACVRAC
eukprot:406729-Amphidinium_carterae.2